jgi:outer membrane protein assembly factor BamE (lipoprotein component of BamABCDE complex)
MTHTPALRPEPRWKMDGGPWCAPLWAALAAICLALLAGCTVPEWQKPGTPRADIERAMGRPTLTTPLPDGGMRLVYSRQPAGQQVYYMDFDARQQLVRVEQALTLEHFQALRNGEDDRDSVYRQFGPPALVEKVYSFHGDIWTYRILENGIPRQAHVHIDPAGVVRRVMFTDERLNDDDRR